MTKTTNTFAGLTLIGLLAIAAVSFAPPVINDFINFKRSVDAHFADDPVQVKLSRDRTAKALCPAYLNGSTWDRWTNLRGLAWCENYRDKI